MNVRMEKLKAARKVLVQIVQGGCGGRHPLPAAPGRCANHCFRHEWREATWPDPKGAAMHHDPVATNMIRALWNLRYRGRRSVPTRIPLCAPLAPADLYDYPLA
jgi:hypothetical protein